MLAYLCVINNPADDLRLRRIINEPARGIGDTTVETAPGPSPRRQGMSLCTRSSARGRAIPELQQRRREADGSSPT